MTLTVNGTAASPEQLAQLQADLSAGGGLAAGSLVAGAAAQVADTVRRLQWWARSYTGPRDIRLMSNPPTVSLTSLANSASPQTSTVNNSVVNGLGAGLIPANDARLSYAGLQGTPVYNGSGWATSLPGTTDTTGVQRYTRSSRIQFITDAPAFEVAFVESQATFINAIIDGQWVNRSRDGTVPSVGNTGNVRYMKFDFGANTKSEGLVSTTASSGGTGYVSGEIVALQGGTFTRPGKVRIGQTSSGAPVSNSLSIEDKGDYSVRPTAPISTASLNGSGTGLTITGTNGGIWSPKHTTRKMRKVTLIGEFTNSFCGIVTTSDDTLIASRFNDRIPKVVVVSDSQNAGTYLEYGGGQQVVTVCERLNLLENLVLNTFGGTGWNTVNGVFGSFFSTNRLAAVISAAPDILYIDGSQNDGTANNAVVPGLVTSAINAVHAALPQCRVIVIGPTWLGQQSYNTALASGVAAVTDQSRVRFVDNVSEGWSLNSNAISSANAAYATSDQAHIGQYALDEVRSKIVADRIGQALISMIPN